MEIMKEGREPGMCPRPTDAVLLVPQPYFANMRISYQAGSRRRRRASAIAATIALTLRPALQR